MKTYTFEIPITGREVIEIQAKDLDEAIRTLVANEGDLPSHVPEVEWSETVTLESARDFLLK